ncbi:beta strand repeat-containing protein [Aeromonas rivuli]|uniref:beta strand repeat-containing protein n=1 Tax=Aeromonas rivuli TaxID=648794 RepID=UPI001CCEEC0E|nr:Ig-like domain-containing protein [Aeromonas rivuli]UBO73676.1 Ig-like domain-containing protein [Aeromonas rivuli]
MSRMLNIFLPLLFTLALFACGGGGGGGDDSNAPDPGPAKKLTSLQITTNPVGTQARAEIDPKIPLGIDTQYQAIGAYSDGSTEDLTTKVSWSSSDTAIATIDESGLAKAMGLGQSTITASYQGVTSNSSMFEATSAIVTNIQITAPASKLAKGLKLQLKAMATFSDGSSKDISAQASWISNQPTLLTVDAKGEVTGKASGTAIVTAHLQEATGQISLSITNATVSQIQITPASLTLAKGMAKKLTAIATLSDQSTQDVSSQVAWLSSNTSIATISTLGLVNAVATGSTTLSASLLGVTKSLSLTVTNATLNQGGLTIATPPLTLIAGLTAQLAATGSYSDGTTVDVTASVSWVSSDPAVATVSLTGLVTAVGPGTATITGTLDGQTVTLVVTVTNATLNPNGLSISTPPLTLAAGLTAQLAANGSYDDGSSLDVTASVSWTSSDPLVATVSPSGLVTAVAPGTAIITGTLSGETATILVTVTSAVLNPGGLTITVPPLTLAAGLTGQLTATGSYSDGSSVDVTADVSWTSSNPAVATVGLNTGLVTAVLPGSATITSTLDGQSVTLPVTVTNAVLNPNGLVITTSPLTLAAGLTGQLTASGTYSDGSVVDVTADVSWTSSDPAVAIVGLNTGLVTAVLPGSATITGTLDGQTVTLPVTVTNAVLNPNGLVITIPPLTLAAGLTGQLTASGTYSDGSVADVTADVSWTSSDPAVATVGLNTGLVTAVLPGSATITGTLDGQTVTLPVTVTSAVLNPNGLVITTSPLTLAAGLTGQLTASGTYSDGSVVDVTADVSWTSSDPAVATVGLNTGLVNAVLPGSATITGTLDGQTVTLPVTVTSAVLNPGGLVITVPPLTLAAGLTGQLTASGTYSDGNVVDVTADVNWTSSDPAVATVGLNTGLVTAVLPGTATITGTLGGQTVTLSVTVTSAVLNPGGLTITVPPLTLAAGLTGQLAVTGSYSDGSSVDVTADVSWTSSDPSVATVGLTGLVTALLPGTATITATLDGQSTTLLVSVSNAMVISVSIDPVNPLAAGTTAQLKATATLSNLTTLDVTAQANWQSSDPSVFTITSTGLATGVVPGSATVTVNVQGIPASQPVTVSNAVLTSLVASSTSSINLLNTVRTITFTATGHYSDGSTQDVTSSAAWRMNGGLLSLGLGNTYVLVIPLGSTNFQAELNGISSNILSFPGLLP